MAYQVTGVLVLGLELLLLERDLLPERRAARIEEAAGRARHPERAAQRLARRERHLDARVADRLAVAGAGVPVVHRLQRRADVRARDDRRAVEGAEVDAPRRPARGWLDGRDHGRRFGEAGRARRPQADAR